jgi:hypothetical protein
VNHAYFSNVITSTTETRPDKVEKFPKFFSDVFDTVASDRYDLIPIEKFEGADDSAKTAYKASSKDQSFVWMASTDPDVAETDEERDVRAATAFLPVIHNLLRPHLSTKEFVTTVRTEVLTRVWENTDASIYSDPSIKNLLASVSSITDDTFFSPAQAKQIMKQFRLLGRIQSHTFDQGTHDFAADNDVEILWITFVNSDSIGLPVGFTAKTIADNNIGYNGIVYNAGSVLFALKFSITDTTSREDLVKPVASLVSTPENVSWLYVPTGERKGAEPLAVTEPPASS